MALAQSQHGPEPVVLVSGSSVDPIAATANLPVASISLAIAPAPTLAQTANTAVASAAVASLATALNNPTISGLAATKIALMASRPHLDPVTQKVVDMLVATIGAYILVL